MSLPAPAVPCLLPTSPQPSHAHTHPLQLFFPFEITQKLLKNKAISVKILFFPREQNHLFKIPFLSFSISKLIHVPPCLRRALPAADQPSTLSHTFSRPYPPLANIFPLRNYSKITAKQSHFRQNPLFSPAHSHTKTLPIP